ncbi:MAG: tRNA pseudouridine(38-40) synthase TruA, partial [Lachnospiraceae bacterium]|nr:tRNA pseudouridine(38-40) synthase TruA [Lachnospiraceae bacterium]
DAGVHARCNAAVFDTESPIAPAQFAMALNARLPEDIRVTDSVETDPDFHPRKCESRKTYEYRIYTGKIDNPIGRDYALHVYVPLDEEKMKQALSYIVGQHDFTSFCATQAQIRSKVRIIYAASLRREEDYLIFSFTGNGFLMNMIRILVGTLLEIGRGYMQPEDMREILLAKDRAKAGPTAPPHGLCLVGYEFDY